MKRVKTAKRAAAAKAKQKVDELAALQKKDAAKHVAEEATERATRRKDAERYRWLKSMWPRELEQLLRLHTGIPGGSFETLIDAALAQPTTKE